MSKSVLTSTTNSIENATIEKYIELVSVNVVVGTNFFSDFGASLTDLFGGLSDTYQNKLEKIYKIGIDKLKFKARNIGANAVIGINIDFDEISGKGKSMFMISAIGTAVKVVYPINVLSDPDPTLNSLVTFESLEQEVIKRQIIKKINLGDLPNQDEWMYLMNSPILEISKKILNLYLNKYNSSYTTTELDLIQTYTPNYFKVLDNEEAVKILYEEIIDNSAYITELIISCNLFSASEIIKLINKGNIKLAVNCLSSNKNFYSQTDLLQMQKIVTQLENLPDLGKIESIKNLLGKSKEKFICQNGHHNDIGNEFCSTPECSNNIKGLNKKEFNKIEQFKLEVESLNNIIISSV